MNLTDYDFNYMSKCVKTNVSGDTEFKLATNIFKTIELDELESEVE